MRKTYIWRIVSSLDKTKKSRRNAFNKKIEVKMLNGSKVELFFYLSLALNQNKKNIDIA